MSLLIVDGCQVARAVHAVASAAQQFRRAIVCRDSSNSIIIPYLVCLWTCNCSWIGLMTRNISFFLMHVGLVLQAIAHIVTVVDELASNPGVLAVMQNCLCLGMSSSDLHASGMWRSHLHPPLSGAPDVACDNHDVKVVTDEHMFA